MIRTLRLDRRFVLAVRASNVPVAELADLRGIFHPRFLMGLSDRCTFDTADSIERWQRIADRLGYPRELVFVPKVQP